MKPTLTILGEEARKMITAGVRACYEPVRKTMGPEGKNGLIYRTYNRGHRITNDGFTIAEVQEPKNEFIKISASAFKEAAKKTNQKAGDGTTGTIVVGGKLYEETLKRISESSTVIKTKTAGGKVGVMSIRKEILTEAEKVKEKILKSAKKIETLEDLEKIGVVSVEDQELGKTIAKMAWDVGPDGFIDVVEGYKGTIETDVIKGMRFPAKVPARAFVNRPEKYEMLIQDCPVVITNYNLDNAAQVGSFTKGLKTAKLAIIAPSFSENVLLALIAAGKQGFQVFPVATPALRTDQYEDLAIYCDAFFINKDKGTKLEHITESNLGFVEKLIVKETEAKEDAVATGGAGTKDTEYEEKNKEGKKEKVISNPVKERIETLKSQILEQKTETYKKLMERRIASMSSGVGVIRVGASSDSELYYKKLKIEDAVYACRAALRGGYVKGGGLCLKEIADELPEDHVLKAALLAPYEQIRENAERDVEITDDIIDPAEAIYWAVENATSVVSHLITVEIITVEERDHFEWESLETVASAMRQYNKFWAKKEGIWKDNEAETEGDRIRLIEEMEANDIG